MTEKQKKLLALVAENLVVYLEEKYTTRQHTDPMRIIYKQNYEDLRTAIFEFETE